MAGVPATRVLLVEDDPEVVAVLGELLTVHGYEVHHAAHSTAAFVMLTAPHDVLPHLVILDIGLPMVSGVAVLEFIRITLCSDLPVVVLTGTATPEQEERLRELGVRAFLRKPASVRVLLSAVAEAASVGPSPLQDWHMRKASRCDESEARTSPPPLSG